MHHINLVVGRIRGRKHIWKDDKGNYYDAYGYLLYISPGVGYIRYDIPSLYNAEGRMSDPRSLENDSGYQVYYPMGPDTVSPPTSGERYYSSPVLMSALEEQPEFVTVWHTRR